METTTCREHRLCPAYAPLRDKLAQLIFVRIGSNMPPSRTAEEDEERVAELLESSPVGGLILFNGSFAKTPQTLRRVQAASRYPLLVGADLERGAGQQLRGYPLLPHAMAFAALEDDAARAVRRSAELTAAAARAAGVHILFAPVADVNLNPRNPIIATRAFGTEPRRVAELVRAFVEGCAAGGGLATAKHFPGHGNTHEDSHHALPRVDAARTDLAAHELPPFIAAIDAGAPLIMTAHVRYPSLDPSGAAATHSRAILVDLLRREMGFQGVVVSDSLLMAGAQEGHASEGSVAAAALAAGVDALLDVADPLGTLAALEAAVDRGRLSLARVNEAFSRVISLKQRAFLAAPTAFDESSNRVQTAALAADAARGAISVLKNSESVLPFRRDHTLCAALFNPYAYAAGAMAPTLADELRARFPRVDYHMVGAEPSDEELKRLRAAATAAGQFLAAIIVKPAAWQRFGLPPRLTAWLQGVAARRPTVVACLGAPQGLEPFAAAHGLICALSDVPASEAALAEALAAPPSALPR